MYKDLQKKPFPKLKTAGVIPTKRYTIFGLKMASSGIEIVKIADSWITPATVFKFGSFPFCKSFYTSWRSAYV